MKLFGAVSVYSSKGVGYGDETKIEYIFEHATRIFKV